MDKQQWQKANKKNREETAMEERERKERAELRRWADFERGMEKKKKEMKETISTMEKHHLAKEVKKAEEKRGERDPQGRYVALAYNTIQIQHWCRIHDINPMNIRPINNPQDVRGGYDLIVVCFSDFANREDTRFRDACTILQSRAIAWRYPDKETPVVERGRIVGWKKSGGGESTYVHVERTGGSG